MANLKIIIDGPLMDGHRVTFKAPCACTGIDKLDIRYVDDDTQKSKLFTMKDTHGNNLTGLGNLFDEGAYVQAILSLSDNGAYLQNAATNGYLEEKFSGVQGQIDNISPYGGTLSGAFNIDDVTCAGRYWCHPTADTTGTILSSFIGEYGELEVLRSESKISGSTMQRFTIYANGDTYIRWHVNAKWHDWHCISSSGKTVSQGAKSSGGSWSIAESKLLPCTNLLFALKDGDGRISLTRIPIDLVSTTSTKYVLNPLFGGGGDTAKAWGDVTIVKSGTTVTITYTTRVQDACTISNCTLYLER